MQNKILLCAIILLCLKDVFAQIPGATIYPGKVNINGNLDMLDEFSTRYTIPIEMPDGIKLMTDITLPELQDSLTIVLPDIGIPGIAGERITVVQKGVQVFYYDSLNGQPNPNPYSMPMVLTRTPYDKTNDIAGRIFSLFGAAYVLQDMRGRYSSEGVYFPMMSDSWNKNAYHNYIKHILDYTQMQDPKNGNRHEDGYNTIEYLVNHLIRLYDVDGNGVKDTFKVCNGSLGMFGASALGNTQYQAAGAHRIDPMAPGLKALMPIVATNEHYRYTGYQNGVFRERIVTGWLKGQIFDVEDDLIPIDFDRQNNIHTSADYDLPKEVTVNNRTRMYQPNKFDASTLAIDHFVRMRYQNNEGELALPGYYPNSVGRSQMDASHAPVDENGESVMKAKIVNGVAVDVPDSDPDGILGFGSTPRPNLNYSRYTNMDVPCYHLTGWWDIFIDGQIETWRLMKENISPKNAALQKLVIGPWAHQTVGSTKTGDMQYKENVTDILGFNFGDLKHLVIEDVLKSEVVGWFRYTLNYNDYANTGVPKVKLPKSNVWQPIAGGTIKVRVPAEDYKIPFNTLLNFINGTHGLTGLKVDIDVGGLFTTIVSIDVPALGTPMLPELAGQEISAIIDSINFSGVANVRFYVIGPIADGIAANATTGNYWFHSDTFPIVNNIRWTDMFLHQNGKLDYSPPSQDEGYSIYIHDPDDPIYTIGGANMIVNLPDGHKSTVVNNEKSQGQINLADPRWRYTTMDRHGVVAFETDVLTDTLCVIGYPEVKLYAKSSPGGQVNGPTDTDFFVRFLDVYPDGRQFFVVEGCVNARARDYAKALAEADGLETAAIDNIPFTNIEIGKIYEYHFRCMPIAYTWGVGHRLKILISSSNYTRYQVNPNLPIEDGDFFRRQPLDGQKYIFNGVEMKPRVAVQRIAHSLQYPTSISLPVYNKNYTGVPEVVKPANGSLMSVLVYPNPASEAVNVYMSMPGSYELIMSNEIGLKVLTATFADEYNLDITRYEKGIYLIEVRNTKTNERCTSKLVVQ
ncbi:MAG: hypothetical protein KatS3mg031_1323 [Chitinophagales bacterium]|nr:MAG: hypothetical protein KatS3mg031_1323 [Chitinophagales bacterium]